MSDSAVLQCRDLGRTYRDGNLAVEVLREVSLELAAGDRIAIVGASGSGKSTLLNLLGGLDQPSSGQVLLMGRDLTTLSEGERCQLRNRQLGFVYQFHHLLAEFSALENVAMPLLISGEKFERAAAQAGDLLQRIGLSSRLQHRPAQLSGGERQRVAIARALVMKPGCVLMDEPTGNLDPGAARQLLELIDQLKQELSTSFVVVTHDQSIAAHMDTVYALRDGLLERVEAC